MAHDNLRHVRLLLVLFCTARAAFAIDITSCGQTIPAGQVGTLTTDVSCGGAFVGVDLGNRATLMMNGHDIRDAGGDGGVRCLSHCTISGPGEITSSLTPGVYLGDRGQLTIADVQIDNCDAGITSATQSTHTKVLATGVNLIDNVQYGLFAARATLANVNAIGNTIGVLALQRLRATVLVAGANAQVGVFANRLTATSLTAQDNGDVGVQAGRVHLTSSVVTNNHGDSGSILVGHVIDLRAKRAVLVDSVCHYSQVLGGFTGQNLGVCTND